MTKAECASIVAEKCELTKKEATELVELFFDLIKETLERGEDVKISGFGKFAVKRKATRKGRNPQTGEPLFITGRNVLTFHPSAVLKQALNSEE